MKEFYIYMGVIIIWALYIVYIDFSEEIFKSCIIFFLVFGLKQLIEIKNNTK